VCVAEVEEIVAEGELSSDSVHTPGIYVDRIVAASCEKRIEQRKIRGSENT
jgi:3-oxoacid CoA-transferase subunit A